MKLVSELNTKEGEDHGAEKYKEEISNEESI